VRSRDLRACDYSAVRPSRHPQFRRRHTNCGRRHQLRALVLAAGGDACPEIIDPRSLVAGYDGDR
jgi:hypothetical protein